MSIVADQRAKNIFHVKMLKKEAFLSCTEAALRKEMIKK